jgi:hypothetical protein
MSLFACEKPEHASICFCRSSQDGAEFEPLPLLHPEKTVETARTEAKTIDVCMRGPQHAAAREKKQRKNLGIATLRRGADT